MIHKSVTITITSSAGVGNIRNDDSDWTNCRNASDGDSNGGAVYVKSERGSGFYSIQRTLIPIDTSSIPAYGFVLSATLRLYLAAKSNNIGSGAVHVISPTTQASTSSIANADFDTVGGSSIASLTDASLSTGGYVEFVISNPNNHIVKAGTTKFGLREYWDWVGTTPSSQNINYYDFNSPADANKPQLVIKYAVYGRAAKPNL